MQILFACEKHDEYEDQSENPNNHAQRSCSQQNSVCMSNMECDTSADKTNELDIMSFIRKMTKGGFRRKSDSWSYVLLNEDLLRMSKTMTLKAYVDKQQRNYVGHIVRKDNASIVKRLLFNDDPSHKTGPRTTLLSSVIKTEDCLPDELFSNAMERKLYYSV